MYRIMIVDDDAILTMELEEYLSTIGYEVVGIASSGLEAVEKARALKPDLILMDIRMPGKLNGIEAAGIIKSELFIEVIFISGYADEELLEWAKLMEPIGYIIKPFLDEQIAAALKIACYRISKDAIWSNPSGEKLPTFKNLTAMEIRIAHLIKKGKNTNEISVLLERSPSTVIWHRKNIRKKLGISEMDKDIRSILMQKS